MYVRIHADGGNGDESRIRAAQDIINIHCEQKASERSGLGSDHLASVQQSDQRSAVVPVENFD